MCYFYLLESILIPLTLQPFVYNLSIRVELDITNFTTLTHTPFVYIMCQLFKFYFKKKIYINFLFQFLVLVKCFLLFYIDNRKKN